ncbi:hypothetical protein ACWEPC_30900, partial [Nonomuraea sp. NPDC004297]
HTRQVGALQAAMLSTQLQEAASDLIYQVSVTLYDSGKLAQSEHASAMALDLAHHAQDFPAQARAYDAMSRVALYRNDPTRAVQYAQRGLRIPGLPVSRASSLHMRFGRALVAIPGHRSDARNALETALDARGLSPFAEAALGGDVAIGLSRLGEYDQANLLLHKAADAMGQYSPLFQAQYLGRQAQTAVRAGKPGLAAEHMGTLTRALPFVNSARVNSRVRDILHRTKSWDQIPEIRAAREHLQGMLTPENPPA